MKTRSVKRSRLVPHTVDGRTEMVLDRYTVDLPVPPRDWDHTILAAVTTTAGLMVTASVIWSTGSIGDLLSGAVAPVAAYSAAAVFDLAWIMCMAVEWLARYDAARAAAPRRAGHWALAIAMTAVAVHGWTSDQAAVGIIGAAVSGIAKGGWTVVLRHHAKPLDALTQQWVDKQRAQAGGQLAMVAVRRELHRTQAAVDAEAASLGVADPSAGNPDTGPERPDAADADILPIAGRRLTIMDAVRTAVDSGIHDDDAILRYVRTAADPAANPETVRRYIRTVRRTG